MREAGPEMRDAGLEGGNRGMRMRDTEGIPDPESSGMRNHPTCGELVMVLAYRAAILGE
jgi:hypothetical protein